MLSRPPLELGSAAASSCREFFIIVRTRSGLTGRRALESEILHPVEKSAHQKPGYLSLRVTRETNSPVLTNEQVVCHWGDRLSRQLQSTQDASVTLYRYVARNVGVL